MKRFFILLSIVLVLFSILSSSVLARENMTRIGLTFLGTGFLSVSIERHFGDNSVRMNVGFFDLQELCTSLTANRRLKPELYTKRVHEIPLVTNSRIIHGGQVNLIIGGYL